MIGGGNPLTVRDTLIIKEERNMKHETCISAEKAIKKYGPPPAELVIQIHEVEPPDPEIRARLEKIGGSNESE